MVANVRTIRSIALCGIVLAVYMTGCTVPYLSGENGQIEEEVIVDISIIDTNTGKPVKSALIKVVAYLRGSTFVRVLTTAPIISLLVACRSLLV